MNNIFYEMIFKRKSFHIFRNVGNESISKDELNDIQSAYSEFTPLNPGIKTAIRIVPEKQAKETKMNKTLASGAGEQMKAQYSFAEMETLLSECGFR